MKARPWVLALALSFPAYAGMENPETGETCQGIDCVDMNNPGHGDSPAHDHNDQGSGGGSEVCKKVTLTGRILYNDLREQGRFADRSTLFPNLLGAKDAWANSTDRQNYLGMKGARILFYEVDSLTPPNQGCSTTAVVYVGSTHADSKGEWSWSGTVCDTCRLDSEGAGDNGVSVAAKISLDHCPSPESRCFSVDDPGNNGTHDHYDDNWSGTTWSRWYRGADTATPRRIFNATPVSLGYDYFQANLPAVPMQPTDLQAQAANVFASMIDATQRVHLDENIDFDYAKWGKIRAYFPSSIGGTAHSHQADRLCVAAPQTRDDNNGSLYQNRNPDNWIDGYEVAHEYGHLVHYWQWGGFGKWQSFCFDSDGDGHVDRLTANGVDFDFGLSGDGDFVDECKESSSQREYAGTAFKEGWAKFIARVTFEGANTGWSCASLNGRTPIAPGFRLVDGQVCPAGATTCSQGRHFYDDVEHALCEIWDGDSDDTLQVPLTDLVESLGFMWTKGDAYRSGIINANSFGPTDTSTAPLGLCELAEHLVEHLGLARADVRSALRQAKIDCNL
jgi:hypothetical protein